MYSYEYIQCLVTKIELMLGVPRDDGEGTSNITSSEMFPVKFSINILIFSLIFYLEVFPSSFFVFHFY